MKLLPFENIDYETKLTFEEIRSRLAADIEPRKLFRFSTNPRKKYEGHLHGNRFEIRRIINYRNSFLPNITGTIEDNGVMRTVNVQMILPFFVLLFLCVWSGALLLAMTTFLVRQIASGKFDAGILFVLLILLVGYALTMAGFTYEASKARAYFDQLFNE
jgi:hypothetical protein